MAKLKHIAIATQDPDSVAEFYKTVFELDEVGRVDNGNAEGYYLTDGNINIAVLHFKNEVVAGEGFAPGYSGLHHIGFQVQDAATTDAVLRKSNAPAMDEVNNALHSAMGSGHGGRNVETKYAGPDGVMIDISQGGWVGT